MTIQKAQQHKSNAEVANSKKLSAKANDYKRPFLKWAGGKYRVLPKVLNALPSGKKLIEPFVGSGVVFLNADYERYLLTDINPDLINLFNDLKKGQDRFIDYCSQYFVAKNNNEKRYYQL